MPQQFPSRLQNVIRNWKGHISVGVFTKSTELNFYPSRSDKRSKYRPINVVSTELLSHKVCKLKTFVLGLESLKMVLISE